MALTKDNIKEDFKNMAMSESDILDKYILCRIPFIFNDKTDLYPKLKKAIALHFHIDIVKIHMIGSAMLGFSIAKDKLLRDFNENSDIDVVIISESVFNNIWEDISDLNMEYYDQTERDKEKYESFLKYFFHGWIRPDFLPFKHKLTQDWFNFFRDISYKDYGQYKITGAVFKNEFFFRRYHEKNIGLIRKGV